MDEHSVVERLGARFGASRSEAVGMLAVVLAAILVVLVLWWWQRPTAGAPTLDAPTGAPALAGATVVVHVTGAVRTPGVVTTTDGARVVDVLALAGGANANADLRSLNLARLVVDGEQIVVPPMSADADRGGVPPEPPSAWDADGRLNLNLASAEDLEELPGVGPVLAQRILQHREANGPFRSTGDLRAVAGIGEKTFQSLADLIVV